MPFVVLLEAAVGIVFVVAGCTKMVFHVSVAPWLVAIGFKRPLDTIIGRTVAPLEIAAGTLLVAGFLPILAGTLAGVLAISFSLVQARAFSRGVAEDCQCFGILDAHVTHLAALARSVLLALAATAAVVVELVGRFARAGSLGSESASRMLGALIGFGAIAAFVLLVEVWRFARIRPRPVTTAE